MALYWIIIYLEQLSKKIEITYPKWKKSSQKDKNA